MEPRPKIKLTLSPFDKSMELVSIIFLVVMWGLTIFTFQKLPAIIPTHFNAAGQPDDYGNKKMILILPILATLIFFVFTALIRLPHKFNYLTKITGDNAHRQYTIATRMLRYLKLAIPVLFSLIILFTYLTAIGVTNGLGVWFLPVTLAVLLIPTFFSVIKLLKKENKAG